MKKLRLQKAKKPVLGSIIDKYKYWDLKPASKITLLKPVLHCLSLFQKPGRDF